MSGVNGGIDYHSDTSLLPVTLVHRVEYVQKGLESPTRLIFAVHEIAAASQEHAQIPVLVDMLGFNNPVAADAAVDALVMAGRDAVPVFLFGVAAFNHAVNAYALCALGRIGDSAVAGVCEIYAASGPIPNVRRAACRALGRLAFHGGYNACSAYTVLVRLADREPNWGVRYASIVALEQFKTVSLVAAAWACEAADGVTAASEGRYGVSTVVDAQGEGKVQQAKEGAGRQGEHRAVVAGSDDDTVNAVAAAAAVIMRHRLDETFIYCGPTQSGTF